MTGNTPEDVEMVPPVWDDEIPEDDPDTTAPEEEVADDAAGTVG